MFSVKHVYLLSFGSADCNTAAFVIASCLRSRRSIVCAMLMSNDEFLPATCLRCLVMAVLARRARLPGCAWRLRPLIGRSGGNRSETECGDCDNKTLA